MKKVLLSIVSFLFILTLIGCQDDVLKDVNVSYISEGNIAFTEVVPERTSFLPETQLTKDGYVFKGWFMDEELNFPFSFNAGIEKEVVLFAKWELATEEPIIKDPEPIEIDDILHLVNEAQVKMLEKANKSVVMIDIISGEWEGSGGSGVIYKKVDNTYYVLTNQHVTEDSNSSDFKITVFNGETQKEYSNITKVHELLMKDLAILKFTTTDELQVIELADNSGIKKGSTVFAIGSPVWFPNIITQGVISFAKTNDSDDAGFDADVIMHTAPINPGNSGGALINIYGQLVGINAYSYPMYDEETDLQLYNFAIHIDEVKAYIANKN